MIIKMEPVCKSYVRANSIPLYIISSILECLVYKSLINVHFSRMYNLLCAIFNIYILYCDNLMA